MELQTLFEMEDIAGSKSVYHVVSSVPDFQTKLADSRPAHLALLCLFKNGGGERWKNSHPPSRVLNVPNRFLVYLKIQLYHSSQSQYSTLHQIQVRYLCPTGHLWPGVQGGHLLGVGDGDGEGWIFPFLPVKSLRMKEKEQQEILTYLRLASAVSEASISITIIISISLIASLFLVSLSFTFSFAISDAFSIFIWSIICNESLSFAISVLKEKCCYISHGAWASAPERRYFCVLESRL